jgi:hypothetical protein
MKERSLEKQYEAYLDSTTQGPGKEHHEKGKLRSRLGVKKKKKIESCAKGKQHLKLPMYA